MEYPNNENEKSKRVLELQRKQKTMQDIHLQMQQGSTRQVPLTEQMVADITDDKTVKLSSKLKEMKQPYYKTSSINKNASKAISAAAAM